MSSVIPAGTEEIAAFKRAAAKRYAELGVPADAANSAFERWAEKSAVAMGLIPDQEFEKRCACTAGKIRAALAKRKKK